MESYLFYSVTSLGICWFIYLILLKREKSFWFNRFYLLGSIIICLLAPALEFELNLEDKTFVFPELIIPIENSSALTFNENKSTSESLRIQKTGIDLLPQIILVLYLLITFVFLFRFFKNLTKITRLIEKKDDISSEGLWVIPTQEKGNTFSFFNFVFINQEELENKNYSSSIMKHEAAHSRQYHSADILILELLSCFFWYNPFIWLYRKAILINHEFLADEAVIGEGIDLENYSKQLIQAGNKSQHFQLISGFNYVQTKKRLLMLHADKSHKVIRATKKLSVFTLLTFIVVLCSFSIHKVGNLSQEFIETENSTSPAQLVNVPFAVVDEPPVFPGCENLEMAEEQKNCFRYTIAAYVSNSISREATLLYTQPEGYNVTVVFRIDTEGKIANVRARATSPKLDAQDKAVLEAEAILVVNSIPQMTPGKHNDQVVGVDYAIRL